jgi:hypothetical protein
LEEGVDRNPLMSNLQRIPWKLNMDQLEYHLILESYLKQKTNVISTSDGARGNGVSSVMFLVHKKNIINRKL